MNSSRIRTLVECALAIALATVLSFLQLTLPQGGGVTLLSMLPIVLMSFRYGTLNGLLTGFVYSVLQMIIGFENVMYCPTLGTQILCILLDYILAYTCLGLASWFGKFFSSQRVGIGVGTATVCFLRFLCHFASGILLWGAYAPEGQPVWLYSLIYNGSYMLVELILTTVFAVLIYPSLPNRLPSTGKKD